MAGGGRQRPVGTESHRLDVAPVLHRDAAELTGSCVPQAGHGSGGRGEGETVRPEGHAVHGRFVRDGLSHSAASSDVPQLDSPIKAHQQRLAVGTVSEPANDLPQVLRGPRGSGRSRQEGLAVPEANPVVAAASGQALAVGVQHHGLHFPGVPQRLTERRSRVGLPELHRTPLTPGQDLLAVGSEADAKHARVVVEQSELAPGGVPDTDGRVITRRGQELAVGAEGDHQDPLLVGRPFGQQRGGSQPAGQVAADAAHQVPVPVAGQFQGTSQPEIARTAFSLLKESIGPFRGSQGRSRRRFRPLLQERSVRRRWGRDPVGLPVQVHLDQLLAQLIEPPDAHRRFVVNEDSQPGPIRVKADSPHRA